MPQKHSDFIEALIQGGAPIGPMNMNMNMSSMGPGLNLNDFVGILQNVQPTRVEDDDYENIEEFVEAPDYRNPLQKALDFYRETPQARLGIGALFAFGGLAFFGVLIGICEIIDWYEKRNK